MKYPKQVDEAIEYLQWDKKKNLTKLDILQRLTNPPKEFEAEYVKMWNSLKKIYVEHKPEELDWVLWFVKDVTTAKNQRVFHYKSSAHRKKLLERVEQVAAEINRLCKEGLEVHFVTPNIEVQYKRGGEYIRTVHGAYLYEDMPPMEKTEVDWAEYPLLRFSQAAALFKNYAEDLLIRAENSRTKVSEDIELLRFVRSFCQSIRRHTDNKPMHGTVSTVVHALYCRVYTEKQISSMETLRSKGKKSKHRG